MLAFDKVLAVRKFSAAALGDSFDIFRFFLVVLLPIALTKVHFLQNHYSALCLVWHAAHLSWDRRRLVVRSLAGGSILRAASVESTVAF